jgi:hypothetical protein
MKKNKVIPNVTILASAMICGSRVSRSGIQLTENSLLPTYRIHIWVADNFLFSLFDDDHTRLEQDYENMIKEARNLFEKHKEADNTHTCRFKE